MNKPSSSPTVDQSSSASRTIRTQHKMTIPLKSLVFVATVYCLIQVEAAETRNNEVRKLADRMGKFISMFQIVEFPNDPCNGTDATKAGTCYTKEECLEKGGTSSGACAQGYGVCCTFSVTCGQTSRENGTIFIARSEENGQCKTSICKTKPEICQLRLDFDSFSITGPSTVTASVGKANADLPYSPRRQCDRDSFAVVNTGVTTPPVICGNNKGEHMYVDFGANECVDLVFDIDASSDDPEWAVRASQYPCDYVNLAPTGCTQYFFGDDEGRVMTYNYKGDEHLAYQNQKICVRRETGKCKICWYNEVASDFMLSNLSDGVPGSDFACCGYGTGMDVSSGYDCLIIPMASHKTSNSMLTVPLGFSNFCGSMITFGGTSVPYPDVESTVCSRKLPFEISFVSDGYEFTDGDAEATKSQKGFKLNYFLSDANC